MENLENLESLEIYNVDFCNGEKNDNFYFRSKEKAQAKFDEIVKECGLAVKGNFARDNFGNSVRVGKIAFDD